MTEFQELINDAPKFASMGHGELVARAYAMYASGVKTDAENAKLREYARKLLTGYECGRGELCEGCSWNGWDGDCNARMKARELGVEAE